MTTSAKPGHMTSAEYLAWERVQPERHQYVGGEIFAMAGGSPRHNLLAANVLAALHAASRGGPSRVLTSDQKIHVGPSDDYVYADVTVVCGSIELQPGTSDVIENPTLVVEVLSKSTEQHDRGEKWQDYSALVSLTDYLLVSQRAPRVEHFAREPDGSWRYRVYGPGDRVTLSTGATLALDELYEGAFEVEGD